MPEGILVTGASGFVGGQLITRLADQLAVAVLGAVRSKPMDNHSGLIVVGEISGDTDWSAVLQDQHVIVHTAARTHIMDDSAVDPLAEFRNVIVAVPHKEYALMSADDLRGYLKAGGLLYDLKGLLPLGEADLRL
jgi:nucleoside-diphosphate-sugar epimerase